MDLESATSATSSISSNTRDILSEQAISTGIPSYLLLHSGSPSDGCKQFCIIKCLWVNAKVEVRMQLFAFEVSKSPPIAGLTQSKVHDNVVRESHVLSKTCRDWLEAFYVGAFQGFKGSFSVVVFPTGPKESAWGVTCLFRYRGGKTWTCGNGHEEKYERAN
jgi:hypothetical protein